MLKDSISFDQTGYFSPLICAYLNQDNQLSEFYRSYPSDAAFLRHANERVETFPKKHRKTLVDVLNTQYKDTKISESTKHNLRLLEDKKTVTVTTGHQLNLFTGPLYFLYKIISTINLAEKLSSKLDGINVVPVYWMATEDHDFEEINHFTLNEKKFKWNPDQYKANTNGAVGHFKTEGIDEVLNLLEAELGKGQNAKSLVSLFKTAYSEHSNLANATRYIANTLFKDYGLIIIDADDSKLKSLFTPQILEDLETHVAYQNVEKTSKALANKGFTTQVSPREINLFYLKEGLRERIIKQDDQYVVNDTTIVWDSFKSLKEEVTTNPERFSPNVILRPAYQEAILPNICYIGGGGELAYWLQLKSYFESTNLPMPILLLRNSVLIKTAKQAKKQEKLKVSNTELFLKQHELINRKVRQISNIDIDFSAQRQHLKDQFESMYALAKKTDKSFIGAVKAQEVKQLKGLDHLEKRLLKAQRRKLADEVMRLSQLQNKLFPYQSLQERQTNFSEFYNAFGHLFIQRLKEALDPLDKSFTILTF